MKTIETHIRQYITRHYTVPPLAIRPEHRFWLDLGLNEWEFLDVLVYIENLFKVNVPDEYLNPQLTVAQLSGIVERERNTRLPYGNLD